MSHPLLRIYSLDPNLSRAERAKKSRESALAAAKEAMNDVDEEMPVIKLGDASIAAPFTSKISHVSSGQLFFA